VTPAAIAGTAGGVLAGVLTLMWALPHYNVWQQGLAGQAALARAEQDRQIAVREAEAKRDSSELYAEAEVARAKGVAAANQIIGASLEGNEGYLRYLWITEVAGKEVDKTVVYVPTETNIPILEAGKRP
jgi:regulator of protease activity HflC (stomatin/prohibitin superfamily)